MSIIIQQLNYEHPDRETLFTDINLSIQQGQKASLIGNNGMGKSTLLKIMGENLPIKSGSIHTDSKAYYIPQHFGQYDNMTIAEALHIDKKLSALLSIIDGDTSESNFELLSDDWEIEDKIKMALSLWNLENKTANDLMSNLSGGEKTKIFLAGITIHQPSIILLDEPTNHLDYKSRNLLYEMIENLSATILAVSHDRTLLNLLSHTYELSQFGIKYYTGNYNCYQEQKQIELEALTSQLENKEKELKVAKKLKQEIVERRQKLDARGKGKGEKMGLGGIAMRMRKDRAERTTAKLKDTHGGKIDNAKDEITAIRSNIDRTKLLRMGFHSSDLHKGKILCEAKNINFSYVDASLWKEPLSFKICSGERVLLKGSNGSGKTSLINLILSKLIPSEGELHIADFEYIYLDQNYSIIQDELTIYEQAQQSNFQMPEHEVKTNLSRSMFPASTWDKPCSTLSGGEKMKLVLCCLIVSAKVPDLIILDEPTNNIDLRNMEVLTSSIKDYQGTILLVSHDQVFIEQIGIDYHIDLDPFQN